MIHLIPTISSHALEKASLTIEPFVKLYFPFHGMSLEDFFPHLALFVYTEATIYQIDEEYEKNIHNNNFVCSHLPILVDFFKQKKLWDTVIEKEIENGIRYYELERSMCRGEKFTEQDIWCANQYKCYDFRVLHRLLYKIQKKNCDEKVLQAFWWGERLVDIEDDIKQYSEDAQSNVYNSYSMMVKLYSHQAKEKMQAYWEFLYQQFQQHTKNLDPVPCKNLEILWSNYRASSPIPMIPGC
jgi:hypothetical protein